ncbi:MAG: ECF transporter S component [Herpetosiphonaceae bacterium]|nr:ECF transporter S component [Herpetosiphonaceae bacterium]
MTTSTPSVRTAAPPRSGPWLSQVLLALTSLVGAGTLLYPFALANVSASSNHAGDAPFLMLLLVPLLLGIIVADLSTQQMNARVLAALGMLVAINAVLRLPAGPGDSPTFFFLVMLAGYVYGGRFGFLLGALSLFVSALLTAGIGPWLPFQMLAMGWMGLGTTVLPPLRRVLRLPEGGWGEVALLAVYGWLWGFLFGAVMNLTFWPFGFTDSAISWQPGLGLAETGRRYWAFYLLTSLGWDAVRALFNGLLIVAFGRPLLVVLRRFRSRLRWQAVADSH